MVFAASFILQFLEGQLPVLVRVPSIELISQRRHVAVLRVANVFLEGNRAILVCIAPVQDLSGVRAFGFGL